MRGVAADNRRDEGGQPRSERDYGEPQRLPHVINGVIAVQRRHGQATCPQTGRDISSHAIFPFAISQSPVRILRNQE